MQVEEKNKLKNILISNWQIIAILILASFLIFFRLDRADMLSDDSVYAYRSVGYVDFIDWDNQTTPLVWFDTLPWWGRLSFHDAPPLAFLLQHASFELFGNNVTASRIPFTLAGLLSILFLYLFVRDISNKRTGALAALLLTLANYHIWISRIGYLEGLSVLFITLSLYLFNKAQKDKKFYYYWGVALGLAFLTKYTVAFLVPMFLIYLLIKNRTAFKNYQLYIGGLISIILFMPVIIYNFMMYKTRGHFDVQLSALFGQSNKDWPIIGTGVSHDYFANLIKTYNVLVDALTLPVVILFLISIIYFTYKAIKKDFTKTLLIILGVLFLTIEFLFIGGEVRFLPLYNIFVAFLITMLIVEVFRKVNFGKKFIFSGVLIIFFGYLLFFNINTNLAYKPVGKVGNWWSKIRTKNLGFNQLDEYMEEIIDGRQAGHIIDAWAYRSLDKEVVNWWSVEALTEYSEELNKYFKINTTNDKYIGAIFIYDDDITWFGEIWYFWTKRFYSYYPMVALNGAIEMKERAPEMLNMQGQGKYYFIKLALDEGHEAERFKENLAVEFEQQLIDDGKVGHEIINPRGEVAFRVYELDEF